MISNTAARNVAILVVGVAIGSGAARLFLERGSSPAVVRDIVTVTKMSTEQGDRHRDEHFEQLLTIEQVLALPSRFMRSEALHVLAGRGNSATIQGLIFEANRVSDDSDRENALLILFSRLTELDAHSALALARADYLGGSGITEPDIWIAYALHDFDAALALASAQNSRDRNVAAQALYAAYGFMGTPEADRIEVELGIAPDRTTRARFLYRLADQSPAAAAAYINALEPLSRRQEAVGWLASHLQQTNPGSVISTAPLFAEQWARDAFRASVARNEARADPKLVLDQLISGGRGTLDQASITAAIHAIAGSDLDTAKMYFDQLRSEEHRRLLGWSIVNEISKTSFEEAMAWARANESSDYPMLAMQLFQVTAGADPDRAMREAQAYTDPRWRSMLIANVIQVVSHEDPRKALELSAQAEGGQRQSNAKRQVLARWMQQDPDAAVSWVASQDDEVARELLSEGSSLIQENPEAAMRLLPLLEGETEHRWRYGIAQKLASSRSPEAAIEFVNRFQGQEGHEQLMSAVVTGLAQRDPERALSMAAQLSDVSARDAAYTEIVGRSWLARPDEAAAMLDMIATEPYREMAAGMIGSNWSQADPGAARRWAAALPSGRTRDSAIAGYVGRLEYFGPEDESLIESIGANDIREQAKLNRVYRVMRTDPAVAEALLKDPDISETQRRRVERSLVNRGYRRY